MDTVTIHIDPTLRQFIDAQIAQGAFKSVDDYLSSLVSRESERQRKLAALKKDIQMGIDQLDRGEGKPLDTKAFLAECHKRYNEQHGKNQ